MKERPILFSGPMVRAILEGRKTMTRRVVKAPEWFEGHTITATNQVNGETRYHAVICDIEGGEQMFCPYGTPGDRLWVREAWRFGGGGDKQYRADGEAPLRCKWKPSIHMPRTVSRITLEITRVRVERLQDISEEDAVAEGVIDDGRPGIVYPNGAPSIVNAFWRLWNSLNEARGYGLDKNPWVWVVEFRRV